MTIFDPEKRPMGRAQNHCFVRIKEAPWREIKGGPNVWATVQIDEDVAIFTYDDITFHPAVAFGEETARVTLVNFIQVAKLEGLACHRV